MPSTDSISTAIPYLALALGLLCATGGGELFVRGTVGIACAARVAPSVIAATVSAFATSSPELAIGITSALADEPELSFGNVLGGNIVNITLVLGAALLFGPLAVDRKNVLREFSGAVATPVLLLLMILDGVISRVEATILLATFSFWLVTVVRDARRQREAPDPLETWRPATALRETAIGFTLLLAAGEFIIYGADALTQRFGLSEFFLGATLVAIGTSTPELATAIIARLRHHDEVGIGALLGSNIYNGLFIVGIAGFIAPIQTSAAEAAPALVAGLISLALVYPPRNGVYRPWRGVALLAVYAAYLAVVIAFGR